jgi:hypothetical protein
VHLLTTPLRIHSFNFQNKRSGVLALVDPRLTQIPNQGNLRALFNTPELKEKALVSEIYTCPAYAQILTPELEKLQSHLSGINWRSLLQVESASTRLIQIRIISIIVSTPYFFPILPHRSNVSCLCASSALCGLRALGSYWDRPLQADEKLPNFYPQWAQLDDEEGDEIEFYDG